MVDKATLAALAYVQSTQPLDPELGWRREDIQIAYLTGMTAHPLPRLLSVADVARTLGVSSSIIHDLVRHGELAFVNAGRGQVRKYMRFHQDDVAGFIKRRTERHSYAIGPMAARVAMTARGIDFEESRQQLRQERREKKEREKRDLIAARKAKAELEQMRAERAKRSAERQTAIARNAAAREAKRKAREAKGK